MYLSREDIENTERIRRLNIINSVSGIKPGNLIGTIDNKGRNNLAIFSSVIHLGSNPAMLGFIMRPGGEVRRHTLENITENKSFTINHIPDHLAENAHYTSAKFEDHISEFESCGFTPEFHEKFKAPFVKESPLKMGLHWVESIPIPSNGTTLIVGSIEHLFLPSEALEINGYIDLEKSGSVGISGLNSYYKLNKLNSYPYARTEELPDFK